MHTPITDAVQVALNTCHTPIFNSQRRIGRPEGYMLWIERLMLLLRGLLRIVMGRRLLAAGGGLWGILGFAFLNVSGLWELGPFFWLLLGV
jgi:hypothetical protein